MLVERAGRFGQKGEIRQIRCTPGSALVRDEVLAGEDRNPDALDLDQDPARPGGLERHARDRRQDVDAGWRLTYLENGAGASKILAPQIQQGGAEPRQRRQDTV